MKASLVVAIISLLFSLFNTANAALFIAAHPDDIQLLMNRNAQIDVKSNYPTQIVLLTAGDASHGASLGPNSMGIPYYRARLRAHEMSVRFWQGLNPNMAPPMPVYSVQTIWGKQIETVHMGNVVLYNLNLPDDGTLIRLATDRMAAVRSISPVNTYTLVQLKSVIREIIRINNPATPILNLNTHDPEPFWNPGDHNDHIATGAIVSAAVTELAAWQCVTRYFYKGYSLLHKPAVYNEEELHIHLATIGALNAGLLNNGNKSTWDAFHNGFAGRMELRGILGRGYCNF